MLERIHHIQITIPSGAEDEARAFYCDLLGLPEIEKPASLQNRGGFWILLGEIQIHLGIEDEDHRTPSRAHLAYQVEDVRIWKQKLSAAGFQIAESIPIEGYERFEFRDPFGNRIEFIQAL